VNQPTEWKTQPLGEWPIEIIDGDRSSRYPKRDEFLDEGVPFLNSTNFTDDCINTSSLNYISVEKADTIKKGRAKPLDLLMTTRGSIGKVALSPSSMPIALINAQMLIIRVDQSRLDPKFLFGVMRSKEFQTKLRNFASGSAQPQIPIRDLRQILLRAPPLPTQRRIAAILSAYDDLIENNTRRIAILEEMARRLYEEWFVHFRFPGHEGVKMVESEIGPVPEGWESTRLGDFASEVREAVDPSTVPLDTPYVGLEHIPRRSVTLSRWGDPASVESTKLKFRRGDVLFGKIRPYFHKVSIAPFDGICSSDTIVIRPTKQQSLSMVLCCTSSDRFVDHSSQTSQGTKMPRANWKVLTAYPLPTPTTNLLRQFNEFVDMIVAQTRNLMLRNTNLRTQRDLLLPKLISGEIDVSEIGEPMVEVAAE